MSSNREIDEIVIPESLPLLPVRDVVVFPYMILPLYVGREQSIQAVNRALGQDRLIFLASQKKIDDDMPLPADIYEVGTVAMIMRMRKLPDGRIKILAQGIAKARVKEFVKSDPFYLVNQERIPEKLFLPENPEQEALMQKVREQLEKVISLGKVISPDILMVVDEITDLGRMADLVASNLGLKVEESQKILEINDANKRLTRVSEILDLELDMLKKQKKADGNKENYRLKESFLREPMNPFRADLKNGPSAQDVDPKTEEMNAFKKRIEEADMTVEVRKEALKQLGRLERMHPDASEASIVRTYLDWICELPWLRESEDKLNITNAQSILDEDHYGLEKVKDRILEFLAVRKLKKISKGPILCLSGPPGVGKTSLGKSLARSMGRKFVRISLGGVHDEAEIRGHRRTYVGAMPGRIIQALKQANTNNPVIMLDEIDKLGRDQKGDPSSALLEVLDPEQNDTFRDHYLNLNFDLRNVMFVATANYMQNVPPALKDRMEVIDLSGYTREDKIKIAKTYLVKKQIEENGLNEEIIQFSDEALEDIVSGYTREAGLRNFERLIGSCCRKVAKEYACWDATNPFPTKTINSDLVETFLGPAKFIDEDKKDKDEVGVVTGLAWTSFGGEVLEVEVSCMPGKGGYKYTGSLGDVMKESCQASMSWIRANADRLGVSAKFFEENEVHIHFPSGATPKDGPSAGVTITTALVSLITGIPVSKDVAMTGEISLRGKVLPIGGLKAKALAAMRHGIKTVLFPNKNLKDLVEIPDEYKKVLNLTPVTVVEDVLKVALVRDPFVKKAASKKKSASIAEAKKTLEEAA